MKRNSQSGVALVITLILLAVITFMAISFIVIVRGEAKATGVLGNQTRANHATEYALELAIAQVNAQMLSATNGYSFAMLVSTNIDLPFVPTADPINLASNSYFDKGGNLLTGNRFLQNVAALQILPRAPVFIKTTVNINGVLTPTNEFRYFLDLNRNSRFEPTGFVPVRDANGNVLRDPVTQNVITNFVTGDPQWIGVLEHPDQPHSSSNKFIARYCFIALPVGNSLDINYSGNQSKFSKSPNQIFDGGFYRNEGVGSWELNVPGFLASLNPLVWNPASQPASVYNYQYNNLSVGSTGVAFDDAAAIMQVRFNNSYNNLNTFAQMYPGSVNAVSSNNIDEYAYGPLMVGFFPSRPTVTPLTNPNLRWSGSDNPNAFFTPQDLFNLVPVSSLGDSFSNRLYQVGVFPSLYNPTGLSTFNQYTYYRLLAQCSFESAAEGKRTVAAAAATLVSQNNQVTVVAASIQADPLNLNYDNVNGNSATNFTPWDTPNTILTNYSSMFFTNCADRLIRQAFPNPVVYYADGVTHVVSLCVSNIPVYPVNFYTPAMHRLLQLAANIYDAQHVTPGNGPDFPTVFRPIFSRSGGQNGTNIFISGYVEEPPPGNTAPGQSVSSSQYAVPLSLPENLYTSPAPGYPPAINIPNYPATTRPIHLSGGAPTDIVNLYSAPWIIGAKKGFPNFNQFAMESIVQITRKLQVNKGSVGNVRANWVTNQMYIIGISNLLGAESWNSYSNDYTRGLQLSMINTLSMALTNDQGIRITTNITYARSFPPSGLGFAPWPGFRDPLHTANVTKNKGSFLIPLSTSSLFIPDSIWREGAATMFPVYLNTNQLGRFEQTGTFPLPRFGLNVTNRFRYWMTDGPTGRIIDYVAFDGVGRNDDLLADSVGASQTGLFTANATVDALWSTNRVGGTTIASPTAGIIQQLGISMGTITLGSGDWFNSQLPGANSSSEISGFASFINSHASDPTNLVRQAPYAATRKIAFAFSLQANDPLVHYTPGDLGLTNNLMYLAGSGLTNISLTNFNTFGSLSSRYGPWIKHNPVATSDLDLSIKDPFIRCSDDWQFPETPYPNIGWLGRVHRGTPWQTVYLKSPVVNMTDWINYSGHTNPFVAGLTHPINDWKILDLFTTALNDNATRGQLSINNTNEAAWHAVLDGVVVLTNTGISTNYSWAVLDPNNTAPQLSTIIAGINAGRNFYTNIVGTNFVAVRTGVFTSLGQLLSVPQLTVASPFVNTTGLGGAGLFGASLNNASAVGLPVIADAVYERIPQSIMSLVRVGQPRYVIFAYGQSLKPADRSVYQGGGPYFGMVTNYAIVGETVTRTVVDFANQITPTGNLATVVPPVVLGTTNYAGIAFLPAQPPPKAQVRTHNLIGPQ